ncbi:MAG: hypothetical protein PHX21_01875 [bacterium]|nr:hypothetical protein [bacterium]MDD5528760.1 hypothetical protein [bacterium]
MKNGTKLLGVILAGAIILGCEGPKIKQALDAFTPQVSELEGKVAGVQGLMGQAAELMNKVVAMTQPAAKPEKGKKAVKAPKIEAAQIDSLILQADNIKSGLVGFVELEGQITMIKDSLAILDKKASGENKKVITDLNGKLDAVAASLGEVRNGVSTLDGIKAKLESMKAPVKVEKKGKK